MLDPDTSQVLGAGIVGANAGELIAEPGLALELERGRRGPGADRPRPPDARRRPSRWRPRSPIGTVTDLPRAAMCAGPSGLPLDARSTARAAAWPREHVYSALREAIVSAELEPGLRLSENDLAGELGVSRTPIREALVSACARSASWRSSPSSARSSR